MPRANLKKKLPAHAQHIYDKSHNQAVKQYKNPKKRRGSESQEAAAHKVAWAAVKKEYKKGKDEKWHKTKKKADNLKDKLTKPALEIYKKAFKSSFDEFKYPNKRKSKKSNPKKIPDLDI